MHLFMYLFISIDIDCWNHESTGKFLHDWNSPPMRSPRSHADNIALGNCNHWKCHSCVKIMNDWKMASEKLSWVESPWLYHLVWLEKMGLIRLDWIPSVVEIMNDWNSYWLEARTDWKSFFCTGRVGLPTGTQYLSLASSHLVTHTSYRYTSYRNIFYIFLYQTLTEFFLAFVAFSLSVGYTPNSVCLLGFL